MLDNQRQALLMFARYADGFGESISIRNMRIYALW